MSELYTNIIEAESPRDAAAIFLEKERNFQEKFGFRTDHMCKIESVKNLNLRPYHSFENGADIYFYVIAYRFRRGSL